MRALIFTISLVAVCLLPKLSFSQMGKVDTRYVSESSFLVLQFDIQKLVSYERMGSKDVEDIAKGLKKTGWHRPDEPENGNLAVW